MNSSLIKAKPCKDGYQGITTLAEKTGLQFGLLHLKAGRRHRLESSLETAVLLMTGNAVFHYQEKVYEGQRSSLFDQNPHVLHVPADMPIELQAGTDCEFAVMQVVNDQSFAPMMFNEETMLESEHRGQGLLDDTAYRIVRTVFDPRNRPNSNLVVGEVITFPGRWSSYPPHHHVQPEIYHYRFTESQGYGHAECGDEVFKAHHGDTLIITDEKDHAQTAAPGYGMYYLWLIRNLPGQPYTIPEFTPEHDWTRQPSANSRVWSPRMKKEVE